MRRLFELITIMFVAALVATGAEAKRVALVIGNDKYQHLQTLEKAVADAPTYAEILEPRGFDEVMLETDLTRAESDEAFAAFLDLIEPGDTAVWPAPFRNEANDLVGALVSDRMPGEATAQ